MESTEVNADFKPSYRYIENTVKSISRTFLFHIPMI